MSKSIFRNQLITILAHVSAWCALLLIPLLARRKEVPSPDHLKFRDMPFEGILWLTLIMIAVFYLNYLVLIPYILNQKKSRYYFFSLISLWGFFTLCFYGIKNYFLGQEAPFQVAFVIFPFLLIMAVSLSIRLLVDRTEAERELKERENETLKSELSFLRSQISPHFLFNVMNNVVSLSRVRPQLVEPTLIQLSQLMRYMLYNSDEKKVTIQNEISYLKNYIDLQNLRFGDSVKVIFEKNTEGGQNTIEPMLLIPFVENAFKHGGIGLIREPEIHIFLNQSSDELIFEVKNKFDSRINTQKNDVSGIGLKNVSRRLELLYPNQHILDINTVIQSGVAQEEPKEYWFCIKLKISLLKYKTHDDKVPCR
ncbi:MAG: histidine kinase [Saprospiraceae bacterium]|nr:histidine kinase [Saprospiraceae bacterium]